MDWQTIFLFAWLGVILGGALTYAIGRWAGRRVDDRLKGRVVAAHQRNDRQRRRLAGTLCDNNNRPLLYSALPPADDARGFGITYRFPIRVCYRVIAILLALTTPDYRLDFR
jgi:hypothetical protein